MSGPPLSAASKGGPNHRTHAVRSNSDFCYVDDVNGNKRTGPIGTKEVKECDVGVLEHDALSWIIKNNFAGVSLPRPFSLLARLHMALVTAPCILSFE